MRRLWSLRPLHPPKYRQQPAALLPQCPPQLEKQKYRPTGSRGLLPLRGCMITVASQKRAVIKFRALADSLMPHHSWRPDTRVVACVGWNSTALARVHCGKDGCIILLNRNPVLGTEQCWTRPHQVFQRSGAHVRTKSIVRLEQGDDAAACTTLS